MIADTAIQTTGHRQIFSFAAMLLGLVPLISGCPQPIEVAQSDLLPDAAVFPYVKQPACSHEPHDVAKLAHIDLGLLARVVRTDSGVLVVRAEKGSDQGAAKLVLETVSRRGELSKAGTFDDTGEPGPVLGLDAVIGGGHLLVAITRPDGRVEVVTLGTDGQSKAPLQTLKIETGHRAAVLWFDGAPLVVAGGELQRPDGAQPQFVEVSSTGADAGEAGPLADGGGEVGAPTEAPTDAGAAITTLEIPDGITSVVASGESVGWLRSDDQGVWLEHVVRNQGKVLSTKVAAAGHDDVRVIWAGDRYLVGDSKGADLARLVVAHPRARSKRHLVYFDLGGRMALPRPPTGVAWTAWDNAGARHIGLAQLIAPRHLRFINAALRGTALDGTIYIRRERDIVSADIAWDGHGYVLIWAERIDDDTDQLVATRFSCPDES